MRSALSLFFCSFFVVSFAQQNWVDTSMYQTNGPVHDIQKSNGLIYVQGDFSYAAKRFEPFGHPVNTSNGELFGNYPTPNGSVTAVVSDNNNGWYVAGDFTSYGDSVRHGLAHMTSGGQIDSFFKDRKVNGSTTALHLDGNNLFVAGSFDGVGLLNAKNGSALNTEQGTLPPDFNALPYNDDVLCSVSDGNGGWFIGGLFTQVGGQARNHIAHITSSGQLSDWICDTDDSVLSLAFINGFLYAGGNFTSIAGVNRNYLARVDVETGQVNAWNPSPNGSVRSISGNSTAIFVGGAFSVISNQSRGNGASYWLSNMQLRSWDPFADDSIESLVAKEDRVYLGGYFTTIDGGDTPYFSVVSSDIVSGTIVNIPRKPNDAVVCLAVSDEYVAMGGFFTQQSYYNVFAQQEVYQDANHFYIYRFSPDGTGNLGLTDFPQFNNLVRTIQVVDNAIYLGGEFSEIQGYTGMGFETFSRSKLAKLIYPLYPNFSTDFLIDEQWNPLLSGTAVNTLAWSGTDFFVGGDFESAAGDRRSNLFAIHVDTQVVDAWSPEIIGGVNDMVFVNDRMYFTGAEITQVNGQSRSCAAAVLFPSGDLHPWHPIPTENNPNVTSPVSICGIEYAAGALYVSGNFNTIGATVISNRSVFANLDLEIGNAGGFIYTDNYYNQSTVCGIQFAANSDGVFIGNKKLDVNSGNVISSYVFENANFLGYPYASTMTIRRAIIQNNELITVRLGGFMQRNVLTTGVLINGWDPQPNGIVNCASVSANAIFIGGGFSAIGGQGTTGLFAYNPQNNRIVKTYTWGEDTGRKMVISGQTLYAIKGADGFGESLSTFNVTGDNISEIGVLQPTNASPIYASVVPAKPSVAFSGGRLFVSQTGYTNYCDLTAGFKLLSYDPATNAVVWNAPNNDWQVVNTFRKSGNMLISGSLFLQSCNWSLPPNPLQATDATTGENIGAPSFNPTVHVALPGGQYRDIWSIDDLELDGYDVIMAGQFSEKNAATNGTYDPLGFVNQTYYGIAKTNYNTGQMSPLVTRFDELEYYFNQPRLYKNGSLIFVNGDFSLVNDSDCNNMACLNSSDLQPLNWFPNLNDASNVSLVDNNYIYIGGNFTTVEGQERTGLVRMYAPQNVLVNELENSYCAGALVNATLSSESVFAADNIFSVEISDASGSFNSPLVLATLESAYPSEINFEIPSDLPQGSGYRIRVVASNPYLVGSSSLPFEVASAEPNIDLVVSNTQICSGDQVVLQVANQEIGALYDVYANDALIAQSAANPILLNNITETSDIYVIFTTANACAAQPVVISDTVVVVVTQISAQLSATATEICEGSLVTLSVNDGDAPSSTTYSFYANYPWISNSVLLTSGTSPDYTFSAGAEGTVEYYVELNTNGVCNNMYYSPNLILTIHPLPSFPSISENGSQLVTSSGYNTYQWYYQGDPIQGATSSAYMATQSGNYSVQVTNEFDCMVMSPAYAFVYIGLEDFSSTIPAVYPNPATDYFRVSLPSHCIGFQWYVVDAGGRKIAEENCKSQTLVLDASAWPAGVYTFSLMSDSSCMNLKLVKAE